ncbi:MAG: ABC transporter permease, partial [Actinomycetota bacterium]
MIQTVRQSLRVTERELRFFRTSWRATGFSTFVAPVLFLVALGLGLGGLVDEPASFGDLSYLEYIAPGLLVGASAQMAAGSGLWPIMAGHRWLGFHRAMVSSPIRAPEVVVGWLLWVAVRSLGQASVFLAMATLLGGVRSWWGLAAVAVAGLTAMAVTAPIMAFTATQDSDWSFDPLMQAVVTPLYLFSGVFFATDSLPLVVAWVVRLFPLWHGIELAASSGPGPTSASAPARCRARAET